MLVIPAIDLKDGCVVRFFRGRLNKKVYSTQPVKTAKHWVRQGAELIHIVDLDGAISGKPKNLGVVKQIVKAIEVPIQFGGGVRTIGMIKDLLDLGIFRIILGTKAVENEGFLKKVFKTFKDKVIISVDAKSDHVLVRGWQKRLGNKKLIAFARRLRDIGFKQIIYTDILKDGSLTGPNIRRIKNLLKEARINVIASGGISSLEDLYKLKLLERQGLIGVIVGKALYEGKFTLTQALRISVSRPGLATHCY